MRTKKLLGIGLGSLLLLSLVGFGTAAAAQHQTEAEPPISLEKEVLCRTGENGLQFSLDGNSWMPQSEYEKEIPKIDWWTASEYEDWIATQKTELEALIGTGDGWYDGQGVFHEWTQDSVNAQIWVNKKQCKTKLERTPQTEQLYQVIARAENWLRTHPVTVPIFKWDTKKWGEIPADFGRKG